MSQNAKLRKRIEETIGRQMLDRLCPRGVKNSGPTMIPPIPTSKFIDMLPDTDLGDVNFREKNHQESYEAEVRLYRCFEDIKTSCIVIHQLEITHEQYSAFLPKHGECAKKRCEKGPDSHPCHKQPRDTEGECDFVVVGEGFAAVFEVKGLSLSDRETAAKETSFKGCCDSAIGQRKRMKALILSICPKVRVCEFTVFPNILYEEVDPKLRDRTIIFKDGMKNLSTIIENCASSGKLQKAIVRAMRKTLSSCLLGLWCINKENKWDIGQGCMTRCIKEIDQHLRKALITRELRDEELKKCSSGRKGKQKTKKYPENPAARNKAPELFKTYLNINCVTNDQLDIFNSNERFMWIEGPAGSGKSVAMLGKIIDIVQTQPNKRILVMIAGFNGTPVIESYMKLLGNVATCDFVSFDYNDLQGNVKDKMLTAYCSLLEDLSNTTSNIVFLGIRSTLLPTGIYNIFNGFDYVFVDDFQAIPDLMMHYNKTYKDHENFSIISEGLTLVLKYRNINKISMWIFSDGGQASAHDFLCRGSKCVKAITSVVNDFRSLFLSRAVQWGGKTVKPYRGPEPKGGPRGEYFPPQFPEIKFGSSNSFLKQ